MAGSTTFAWDRQLQSVYGGTNYVAALMVCTVAALLWEFSRGGVGLVRFLILSLPALVTVVATGSRTSTIILIVLSAAIPLLVATKTRPMVLVAVTLGAIAGGAFFTEFALRIGSGSLMTMLADRLVLWKAALDSFSASPLVGTLPGHFADVLVGYGFTNYAHNILLSVLAQGGILGVMLVGALFPWRGVTMQTASGVALIAALLISLFEPIVETQRLGVVAIVLALTSITMRERKTDH